MAAEIRKRLIGSIVLRCEEVEDYLWIELDRAFVSLYNRLEQFPLPWSALVGCTVTGFDLNEGQSMMFHFSKAPPLKMSLLPTDYECVEAAVIDFHDGSLCVVR